VTRLLIIKSKIIRISCLARIALPQIINTLIKVFGITKVNLKTNHLCHKIRYTRLFQVRLFVFAYNFQVIIVVDHDIFRLQISMHYALFMHALNCCDNLCHIKLAKLLI